MAHPEVGPNYLTSDHKLLSALGAFRAESFTQLVFRVTPLSTNPLAPSVFGGRWAPPARPGLEIPILYTSLEKDGALAEVASYLARLTPIPGPRHLKVTRLLVTAAMTLRLTGPDLQTLGVDLSRYGERDYIRTQEIGVAVAEIGFDGLFAPSARWACDNLMIFTANRISGSDAAIVDAEEVEWRAWSAANGVLS
jgi:hypothetical protein